MMFYIPTYCLMEYALYTDLALDLYPIQQRKEVCPCRMVLTKVCDTESFSLKTSSIIWNCKQLEHVTVWKVDLFRLQARGGVLELALSEGPNNISVSLPSSESKNVSDFQNIVCPSYLAFWVIGEVHKPGDSEVYSCRVVCSLLTLQSLVAYV